MRTVHTLLLGFIWLVAAIDIWCCQWLTVEGELNPMARFILAEWGVWTLVSVKVMGTWVATELLRRLHIGYTAAISALAIVLLLILGGVIPV
jgi:hypothetical protein